MGRTGWYALLVSTVDFIEGSTFVSDLVSVLVLVLVLVLVWYAGVGPRGRVELVCLGRGVACGYVYVGLQRVTVWFDLIWSQIDTVTVIWGASDI